MNNLRSLFPFEKNQSQTTVQVLLSMAQPWSFKVQGQAEQFVQETGSIIHRLKPKAKVQSLLTQIEPLNTYC